jgi:hypothetical protein
MLPCPTTRIREGSVLMLLLPWRGPRLALEAMLHCSTTTEGRVNFANLAILMQAPAFCRLLAHLGRPVAASMVLLSNAALWEPTKQISLRPSCSKEAKQRNKQRQRPASRLPSRSTKILSRATSPRNRVRRRCLSMERRKECCIRARIIGSRD